MKMKMFIGALALTVSSAAFAAEPPPPPEKECCCCKDKATGTQKPSHDGHEDHKDHDMGKMKMN